MNERIRELAEQAEWRFADKATGNFSEHDKRLEKFAELIVEKCISICMRNQFDGAENYNNGSVSSAELIKQHFGVEG